MHLLNMLTEDGFFELVNDPYINFLEVLLFCLQTTNLYDRLAGWERGLTDELVKFSSNLIKPKLVEIMTTSIKIQPSTIVKSFLLDLFKGEELKNLMKIYGN